MVGSEKISSGDTTVTILPSLMRKNKASSVFHIVLIYEQECILVGYIPPASVAISLGGGCLPGGCLPGGVCSEVFA